MQVLKTPKTVSSRYTACKLIRDLLAELDANSIHYCHWKSNWQIDRWLRGEGDLDLLVRRQDIDKFTSVLCELGFKKALTAPKTELPGILNFYGFDTKTQKLVHIHAHYQLVFGHDLTKNYRLPIEDAILASSVARGGIFTPAPEIEMILFVVRMVLKYSIVEAAARRVIGKAESHFRPISKELGYLESRADDLKLKSLLHRRFPMLANGLFNECLESLRADATVWQKDLAKRRLERSLSGYARMTSPVEVLTRLTRGILSLGNRFIKRRTTRKKFENGGALIAIVGGDGAGKTTCVNEIHGWLSKNFDTRRVHLGKPPKSIMTVVVAGALKAERKFCGKIADSFERAERISPNSFLQQLRWLCTARDRYRLYRRICRLAAGGTVVICDRYPLPNVRLMDNAKIVKDSTEFRIANHLPILSHLEDWYYRQILPPELTIVLRVEPHTAVNRKTDEPRSHVFSRSKALWELNWQNVQGVRLIDAGRPLASVLADLRFSIWSAL